MVKMQRKKKQNVEQNRRVVGDLFNNPMIEAAKKSMTPEQLEEYKRIGEYMYSNTKFEAVNASAANSSNNNMTSEMLDALDYIVNSIQSGQHISTLEDNEKMILKEAYGERWFEKFDYTENDLTEIN